MPTSAFCLFFLFCSFFPYPQSQVKVSTSTECGYSVAECRKMMRQPDIAESPPRPMPGSSDLTHPYLSRPQIFSQLRTSKQDTLSDSRKSAAPVLLWKRRRVVCPGRGRMRRIRTRERSPFSLFFCSFLAKTVVREETCTRDIRYL